MGRLLSGARKNERLTVKINLADRILRTLEERDGVGVTVAVLASELGRKTVSARVTIQEEVESLYKTRPFRLVKMTEGHLVAYRWKDGTRQERKCLCGHPWWQHEGTPGMECISEGCNCGVFREGTNETETCEMTNESDLERDLALAYQDVLLGAPKVMVHFQGRMGFGRVPAKTIDFESGKPDKKARCIEMLTYQKRCAELLLEEIKNREDEKPKAATDPDQTGIQDALDSPPVQAVIVWHPGTKTEQKEVVAVTEIEDHVYLVRHLANGTSETLFQGTSWADLVDQVLAKNHRLEPMAPAEETAGSEPEAAAPGPQPPADVAATAPAAAAVN